MEYVFKIFCLHLNVNLLKEALDLQKKLINRMN